MFEMIGSGVIFVAVVTMIVAGMIIFNKED